MTKLQEAEHRGRGRPRRGTVLIVAVLVAVVSMALAGPTPGAKTTLTVTKVEPSTGPEAGGTSVTITGTRFGKATAVKFGSTNATSFTVNSATSITAVSPAGSGVVDVTVATRKATSPTGSADQFTYFSTCTGPTGAVEIRGPLHAEAGCDISGATVRGDVIIDPGGSLRTKEVTRTDITGNVEGKNAAYVVLLGRTSIGGRLRLTGTKEGINVGTPEGRTEGTGSINGNMEIEDGVPETLVSSETVRGSVQILNTSGESPSGFTDLKIGNSTVGGNVELANNSLTGEVEAALKVRGTSVAGNLLVFNNTATKSVEGGLEGEAAVRLEANHVGGNAELLNNTVSGVKEAFIGVSTNVVTNTLNCLGNVPPPAGKENTAKQKLGQCASL